MDAVKFIKTVNRMCEYYGQCDKPGCPLKSSELNCDELSGMVNDEEKIVSRVEKWDKEHPIKTRQSEFLKQFPHAACDKNGILNISPCDMDSTYPLNVCKDDRAFTNFTCDRCRKEYWSEEVDD